MILVAGATGLVGKQVALRLRRGGADVRALVRGGRHHEKASDLLAGGVEIVDGDLVRPETLPGACEGVRTVVSTATSMPHGRDDGLRRVDHEGTLALIDAAERSGAEQFVYISYSSGIREESPLGSAKRACEERLRASGMAAVILRPSFFMEVWLGPGAGFDPRGGSARIYGSGEARVSYVSAFDVAEIAAAAAAEEDASGKSELEVGGPEALSQLEAVAAFEEVLEKKLQLQFIPLEALRDQARSPDPLQRTFGALGLAYATGNPVPDAVRNAKRYGIALGSVSEYAEGFH